MICGLVMRLLNDGGTQNTEKKFFFLKKMEQRVLIKLDHMCAIRSDLLRIVAIRVTLTGRIKIRLRLVGQSEFAQYDQKLVVSVRHICYYPNEILRTARLADPLTAWAFFS